MEERLTPLSAATEIWQERYKTAPVVFLAGSLIRGEGTRFSDLDLVVVFTQVAQASRESFYFRGWPVEAFLHDPETLQYFFEEVDAKSGFPSLPQMVIEGIEIPEPSEFSKAIKQSAKKVFDQGPAPLEPWDIERKRYAITDLIDDIREPRSSQELMASGARLLENLADFYFRSHGLWSASGKTIFRRLAAESPQMASQFEVAFSDLFSHSSSQTCISLAENLLKDYGGMLFDGYKLDAPSSWRQAAPRSNI